MCLISVLVGVFFGVGCSIFRRGFRFRSDWLIISAMFSVIAGCELFSYTPETHRMPPISRFQWGLA